MEILKMETFNVITTEYIYTLHFIKILTLCNMHNQYNIPLTVVDLGSSGLSCTLVGKSD